MICILQLPVSQTWYVSNLVNKTFIIASNLKKRVKSWLYLDFCSDTTAVKMVISPEIIYQVSFLLISTKVLAVYDSWTKQAQKNRNNQRNEQHDAIGRM